jgi:hypothetical protein
MLYDLLAGPVVCSCLGLRVGESPPSYFLLFLFVYGVLAWWSVSALLASTY